MSDVLNLRKEIKAFNKSERFDTYSKVIINVNDDLSYEAGDNTGRTLTLSCPWGTQVMAKNILSQMRGFSYQPYTASGAILDPASELGDGINVNGVYSGIYRMDTTFNSHCSTDISAPSDEEIDYEYQYRSKQQREVARKNKYFSSQLLIHADKIEAEVKQRGEDVKQINAKLTLHSDQITAEVSERKDDIKSVKSTLDIQSSQIVAKVNKNYGSSSTFGWALETDSWRIFAGSSTVLKATKSGLEIKGKITATSGTIGGFTINSNYISYNNQAWGGTNATGIYIGTSGIQLGKYFKVDSSGKLTATSGTIGGFTINSNHISYNGHTWGGTSSTGIYIGTRGIQLGKKFKVDSNGNLTATNGTFSGKITATSGTIGGFTINSNYISHNGQEWNGTNSTGIYIGPNGIQLGKRFRVDAKGNLYATTGTFTGNVYAKNIKFDDENATSVTYGTLSGGAISAGSISGGKIGYGTLTTANMIEGINTSLSYADFANGVFNGWNTATSVSANTVSCGNINVDNYINLSGSFYWGTASLFLGTIKDYNGDICRVVMWSSE